MARNRLAHRVFGQKAGSIGDAPPTCSKCNKVVQTNIHKSGCCGKNVRGSRREVDKCCYPECAAGTKGGKEYCTKHVTEMPYVKYLAKRFARLEKEVCGDVPLSRQGLIGDALAVISEHGFASATRLRKDLVIQNPKVLRNLVRALTRNYGCRRETTPRGVLLILGPGVKETVLAEVREEAA